MADPDLSQFMTPTASPTEPDLSQFMGDKFPRTKAPIGTLSDGDLKYLAAQRPNAVGRLKAAVRSATREVFPTATGAAGAATGAGLGALAPPPFDVATIPAGALIGGMYGSWSGKKAQEAAASAVPTSVRSAFGQSPQQVAQDQQTYPVTTAAASMVPSLVAGTSLQKYLTPEMLWAKSGLDVPSTTPVGKPLSRAARINATRAAADRQGISLPTTLTSPTGYKVSRIIPKVVGGSAIETAEAAAPQAVGSKLSDMAAQYGVSTEPGEAGAAIQDAAARWAEKQRLTGGDLLDKANDLGTGIELPPTQTLAYVDQRLAELEKTPQASAGEIRFLNGVKSDLNNPDNPMDLASHRQLRSSWYANQDPGGLLPSAKNKVVGDLWNNLSEDIGSGLQTASESGNTNATEAMGAFDKGNEIWKNRADTLKSTLSKILGSNVTEDASDPLNSVFVASKPPEDAAATIAKMAGSDRRGIATVMKTLDPDAQDTLRASLIASLGRNDAGGFSAPTFLSSMHNIPESTRLTLFGKDTVASLNDLETIVKNISTTPARHGGMGTLGVEMALGGLLGLHGGYEHAGQGIIAVAGANMAVAHLLARPNTLKWMSRLSNAAAKGSDAVAPLVDKLGKAANNDTVLRPLYDAIQTAAAPKAKVAEPKANTDDMALLDAAGDPTAPPSTPTPEPTAPGPSGETATLDPTAYKPKSMDALIPAVIHQESGGNPDAVSPKGATGLMQLMPKTAAELGVDPHDPAQNVEGGTRYLTSLISKYNGNQVLGLLANNWGPHNVDKWIAGGMKGRVPKESRDYVDAVLGN